MSYSTSGSSSDPNMTTGMGGMTSTGETGSSGGGMASQATEALGQATDQAKSTATSKVSEQKDKAAEGLGSVAQAFTQVGDQLRSENPTIAGFADTAADRLQQFAGTLSTKDVTELMDDVEQFARRQPAMFLGAAFALGVVGARFFKSSTPSSSRSYQSSYNRSAGYNYSRYDTGSYGGYTGSSDYGQQGRVGYGTPGYGSSYGTTETGASYGSTGTGTGTTGYGSTGTGLTRSADDVTTGLGVEGGSSGSTGTTTGSAYGVGGSTYGTETRTSGSETGSGSRETYSPYGDEPRTGGSTGSGRSSGVGSMTDATE